MPAFVYLLLPVLFWSGNYVLGRLTVSEGIDPFTISFLRWSIACLIILPFAYKKVWAERSVIIKHWPLLILFSWLGICNYNLFLYLGLTSTSVTNAVLLNAIIPVIILITARVLLGNKTSGVQNLGILLSTIGAIVIISRGSLDTLLHLTMSQGDLWIIAAAISWAVYSVLIAKRPKDMSLIGFFTTTALVGTAIQAPLFIFFGSTALNELSVTNWGTLLYMGLFASLAAFLCWNLGVHKLGAATAGQFIHLLPVFSISLSVLFLGESLYFFHYLGMLLIFSGIFVATLLNKKLSMQKAIKQS
ncbi:DMT family transporter [Marinomonas pollencensis]|uniref:Drug/metabolite transporter (DMT)-like permease n=1 Tax=Marinomonas pollencensis TaxID=491954 RepID=A0A3E0DWV1_9GAMM|nr:DMT family transporter [Marinomonas pollencensis]REG86994.1 drug/metabolite transporter (DMT)-like permease [Marinomonas pollencensis]